MSGIAPTIPAPQASVQTPQLDAGKAPAAQAGERPAAEAEAASAATAKSQVHFDSSAGRFVQILTDSETGEVLRRHPSEAQLAYSRAVMAYLRAMRGGQK